MKKIDFTPRKNETERFEVYFVGEKGNAIVNESAGTAYAAADYIISYDRKPGFIDELSECVYVGYPQSDRCICLGSYKTIKSLSESLEQGTTQVSLLAKSLAEIIKSNE